MSKNPDSLLLELLESARRVMLEPFAATLLRLRTARGLTQKRLGEICELHRAYISKLEHGKCPPPRESTLITMANALGVKHTPFVLAAGKIPSWYKNTAMALLEKHLKKGGQLER